MTKSETPRVLTQPAMRLIERAEDRLVFIQRRSGWAVFLACMGAALALASLMLFQEGRDMPEWLAAPGLAGALLLHVAAGTAWFSRRSLVISSEDPSQSVLLERRTVRGGATRTFGADQARGVALAARPSGKAYVLLLSLDNGPQDEAAENAALMPGAVMLVLGATELGFRHAAEAAEVGARLAAILHCPLLEHGAAAYDAGAEPAHVADLIDAPQRPGAPE